MTLADTLKFISRNLNVPLSDNISCPEDFVTYDLRLGKFKVRLYNLDRFGAFKFYKIKKEYDYLGVDLENNVSYCAKSLNSQS